MKRARDIAEETMLSATQTAADEKAAVEDTTTAHLEITVVRNPVNKDVKDAIIQLTVNAFPPREQLDGQWLNMYTNSFKNPCIVLLDKTNDRVAGSVCGFVLVNSSQRKKGRARGKTSHANIDKIVVHKNCRGKGYGSLLLERALKVIHDMGTADTVCLMTRRLNNEAALRLYEKFDFKTVRIKKNYYPGRFDAVEMERKLVAVE